MSIRIPEDMLKKEEAERLGAAAVVSTRDLILLLDKSGEHLKNFDDRTQILKDEPWRDMTFFKVTGKLRDGTRVGYVDGWVDWSRTRFSCEWCGGKGIKMVGNTITSCPECNT